MTTTVTHDPREILSSRLIDAPRERIFRAFEEPERLARWWGPKDFRNTFQQFDLWPGGHWRFVMHGPDGKNYDNHSVFREVEKPSRIVLEHQSGHHFVMTITLDGEAGKTRIHWRMAFDSEQERDQVASIVTTANEQNLDRLEAELARMP